MITLNDINRLILVMTAANGLFLVFDFAYLSRRPALPTCYRYDPTSTFSNVLVDGIRWAGLGLLANPLFRIFEYVHSHSLRVIPWPATHPAHVLIAFVCGDFAYYLWHRASHENGFFWFGHQAHHHDTQLNASTGLRTGPLGTLLFVPFLAVAVFLGVSRSVLFGLMAANGLYMWFTHSSIGRLPLGLERVLNSPSSHRMHHHYGPRAGRCNYGAVLIVWDRIFGTFRQEKKLTARFGVKGVALDFRPVSHQLNGILPRWVRFDLGHRLTELFSGCELIFMSISIFCAIMLRRSGDLFSYLSVVVLILAAELYPKMKRDQKVAFWIFDLVLLGMAIDGQFHGWAQGSLKFDTHFWGRLAWNSLVFALVPLMLYAGRKATAKGIKCAGGSLDTYELLSKSSP